MDQVGMDHAGHLSEGCLAGMRIMNTRPLHQAKPLCDLIEQYGGQAITFPTIAITPIENTRSLASVVSEWPRIDVVIFVSVNAVVYGLAALQALRRQAPEQGTTALKIAAVGTATAQALQQAGYAVDIVPNETYDSEGLLQCEPLRNVEGQGIIIVRGQSGRELLGQQLRARGAQVHYHPVYQRCITSLTTQDWLQVRQQPLDCIVVTREQGLLNLIHIVGKAQRDDLLSQRLVVISPRLAQLVRRSGFSQSPWVAQRATEAHILQAIAQQIGLGNK